jgi:hypothetical protein
MVERIMLASANSRLKRTSLSMSILSTRKKVVGCKEAKKENMSDQIKLS